MRRAAHVSFLLLIFPAYGEVVSYQAYGRERSTDFKVFEWCLSHFPREEGGSVQLLPRPPGKLRSFDLSNSTAPIDLVTKTRIVGKPPPSIEKYQGYWTWPSIDKLSPGAILVERLTPTEMTISLIRERDRSDGDKPERMFLSWTGTHFAYSIGTPKEFREMEIRVSQSGDVMAAMSGYTHTETLIDKDGKESSHRFSEAWPYCFISSKHY
jgi:hypothetical protein